MLVAREGVGFLPLIEPVAASRAVLLTSLPRRSRGTQTQKVGWGSDTNGFEIPLGLGDNAVMPSPSPWALYDGPKWLNQSALGYYITVTWDGILGPSAHGICDASASHIQSHRRVKMQTEGGGEKPGILSTGVSREGRW